MSSLEKLSDKIKSYKIYCNELKSRNAELESMLAAKEKNIKDLKLELQQKDEEIEAIIAKVEELLE